MAIPASDTWKRYCHISRNTNNNLRGDGISAGGVKSHAFSSVSESSNQTGGSYSGRYIYIKII